jgi:isoleucyl-tRNA synthetase
MADDHTPADPDAPRDYRETVFLPTTAFPMRAGLPKLEPEILKAWAEADLYAAIRQARQDAGADLFVLHDGPPYANGAIHIGHALNKLLKDFVVRSQFALGKDVDYVPGWDCHGLPIEWKVEELFRAKGRRKDEVSKAEFRARCREYADEWIDVQRAEFKRLGVLGRWDRPYLTMDYKTEAKIVGEFHKFLMSGQLYRGSKPVMWSPVERTALAEAEIEYHEHTSPTVWVKFPVTHETGAQSGAASLVGASVVIWTTTPWTLPANRAIAYGPAIVWPCSRPATAFPCRCWPATTSPTMPARALSTPPPATARRTIWSGWPRAGATSPKRWTPTAPISTACRCLRACRSSRPRARRPASSAPPTARSWTS